VEVIFTPSALDDLRHWRQSGNKAVQAKISQLLASIAKTPFEGAGKPEQLKYELAGKWSRRIDREHRLVYAVAEDDIIVYSLRGHYKK
jgi:toxin YoeB